MAETVAASALHLVPHGGPGSAPDMPADATLPGLAEALDGRRMAARFQQELFDREGRDTAFDVEACIIERTKYQPGHRCSIGYRLAIRDRRTGERHDHYLCGRMFEPGGSGARFARYRRTPLAEPVFGPPILHIADLELILWSFPNDRKLAALPDIIDVHRLGTEIVSRLVERHWGIDWKIASLSTRLASYVHERRCTLRVAIMLRNRTDGAIRDWTVYGKISNGSDGADIDRAALRFWDSEERRRGAFGMPCPLGFDPEYGICWQAEVPGVSLAPARDGRIETGRFLRAGAAVAALHRCTVDGLDVCRIDDLILRLLERTDAIRRSGFVHGAEIEQVVDRLVSMAPRLNTDVPATVHGDLHPENIIVDGARISLIDLDESVIGPPLQDIGHFVAYLLWDGCSAGVPIAVAGDAAIAFLDGYSRNATWPVGEIDLAWHTAAALISEKIFRCVAMGQPGHQPQLVEFIALADRLSKGDTEEFDFGRALSVERTPLTGKSREAGRGYSWEGLKS